MSRRGSHSSSVRILLPRFVSSGEKKGFDLSRLFEKTSKEALQERASEEQASWEPCKPIQPLSFTQGPVVANWQSSATRLLEEWSRNYRENLQTELRVDLLEKVVAKLAGRVAQLESNVAISVPIQTFEGLEVTLRKPFSVVVQPHGDSFVATFFDANIGTSGDTQEEAVSNLKDLIAGILEQFEVLETEKALGPEPTRQLAILRQFIARKPK
jgi:hypothetical protein